LIAYIIKIKGIKQGIHIMKKSQKPRIFIGSSVESISLAYAVQKNLRYVAEVTVWDQGVFELSRTALESLLKELDRSDFGAFILAPDDIAKIRGQENRIVRDNVIFELGLFIGRLGIERCFFITPDQKEELHLPSDLLGISSATYETNRQDGNIQAALGPACYEIRLALEKIKSNIEVYTNHSVAGLQPEAILNAIIFQPVGALKAGHLTYIKRDCDKELKNSLLDRKQIVISGEFQIGKSSLLRQIPMIISDGWINCLIDFQGLRTHNVDKFMEGFYKGVSRTLGYIDSLDEFVNILKNKPTVLSIDEFGRLTPQIADSLIPNLYWLLSEAGDNLRLVVCLPKHINDVLVDLKIENPKYHRNWKHIKVKPFNQNQVIELLKLLPKKIREIAVSNCDLITKLSRGNPQVLQSLCYKLVEKDFENLTHNDYFNIITDQNNYYENF
jgi:predicted nucleotide-binding protein